jgi:L-alanine-DL-glutamate epimerase-like enolase superfamily enzyme
MAAVALERIVVRRLEIPLAQPYRLAFGTVERFDTLVVECVARDGRSGLGEATLLTGYTGETIDESWSAMRELAGELVALEPAAARRRLEVVARRRPFAATAFGTALEMLEESPHLRIERETAVALLALLGASGEQAMQLELERLLAEGFGTIKLKVGFDVARDLEHVATAQRLARGRVRIRIDANQGYNAAQGIAFVRGLDPAGIELFEQPCAAGDWDAHLAVARAARVPVMLDESIYGIDDIERAARLGAASYLKLKLMKLGTLEALVGAIERVRALGMRPVLGNGVACDLGCWMEACVAARHIDNAGEMNGFLKARERLLRQPLQMRRGALVLEPGFDARLDLERVKPFVAGTHAASARAIVAAG